jgi:DNA-binding MurR/RpiR family transcriptional regulator
MQLSLPAPAAEFTKAEQKILEYIGSHAQTFIFMSIKELSSELDVSDATVSRFAKHAGCKDFKALKSLVMRQNQSAGPAEKMAGTLLRDSGFTVEGWLEYQRQCLQKTLEHLDPAEVERAASAILAARRVFIHAKSASRALGELLLFRLRRLGVSVFMLPSGGSEVLEGLAQAGVGDLVVMFSFSKVSREGGMILDHAKSAGYQTLAFTSRLYVPEQERADVSLFVYRGEEKEYHSMTAPAAVTDALVVAVSESMGAGSARQLSRLHKLKEKYR